jgi:hypothetical protein
MVEQIDKTNNKSQKIDNRYIFPNFLADAMSKVDFRTQNESALLSQTLLIIGMILMALYMVMYSGQTLYFKVLLVINLVCGIIFISSYLVTTYQQYKSYMDTVGISSDAEKAKIKAKGNVFKRISLAWKNRKQKKIDAQAVKQIGNLMEKSGMAKEVSKEEKDLDAEIEELMGEKDSKIKQE